MYYSSWNWTGSPRHIHNSPRRCTLHSRHITSPEIPLAPRWSSPNTYSSSSKSSRSRQQVKGQQGNLWGNHCDRGRLYSRLWFGLCSHTFPSPELPGRTPENSGGGWNQGSPWPWYLECPAENLLLFQRVGDSCFYLSSMNRWQCHLCRIYYCVNTFFLARKGLTFYVLQWNPQMWAPWNQDKSPINNQDTLFCPSAIEMWIFHAWKIRTTSLIRTLSIGSKNVRMHLRVTYLYSVM